MALLRLCLFAVRQRFGDVPNDDASSNDSAWHLGDIAEHRAKLPLHSAPHAALAGTQSELNKLGDRRKGTERWNEKPRPAA